MRADRHQIRRDAALRCAPHIERSSREVVQERCQVHPRSEETTSGETHHARSAAPPEEEELVAQAIEEAVLHYDGRSLGPRTFENGTGPTGLAVDYVYHQAETPVALEITGVIHGPTSALSAALVDLQNDLKATAEHERLGSWLIGLVVGTRVNDIRELLRDFIRDRGNERASRIVDASDEPELSALGFRSALYLDDGDHGVSLSPPIADASAAIA